MYSVTANRARAWVRDDCRYYNSFFGAAKKDSAAALSQHTPVRPRLRRMRFVVVNVANSADVYCVPLSEWQIASPARWPPSMAICRASVTRVSHSQ